MSHYPEVVTIYIPPTEYRKGKHAEKIPDRNTSQFSVRFTRCGIRNSRVRTVILREVLHLTLIDTGGEAFGS
jgi:hypothetical protein